MELRASYDVVVGAGSAGCALAGRLTEDPAVRVLLLEAGGSDKLLEVQVPAGLYKVWRTRHDWNYTTVEQPGLDGRRLFWPRGRLLGVDQRDDLHPRRPRGLRRVGPAHRRPVVVLRAGASQGVRPTS